MIESPPFWQSSLDLKCGLRNSKFNRFALRETKSGVTVNKAVHNYAIVNKRCRRTLGHKKGKTESRLRFLSLKNIE